MNNEWYECIKAMRDAGYAVCIFNPDELGTARPDHVEEAMCERGWGIIEDLNSGDE